ncbi:MAG: DUF3078 domain-containing protein [Ferruginibacter sp.]
MRFAILISFFLLPGLINAQDKAIQTLQFESGSIAPRISVVDTSHKLWKRGGMYRLNLGQGSLSNWAAGGDDFSINVNTTLNLFATYKKNHYNWDNSLDLAFGFLKTTTLGTRKTDDRFDLVSKYTYSVNPKTTIGLLGNVRTQFFNGYSYATDRDKIFASGFLSPGYVLTSLGMDLKPKKEISLFLSPMTSRWVIVKDDTLASKASYGVDSGKNIINQLGAFATVNFEKELVKNLTYKTRLDLFSNYKKNPLNIDVYMTNIIAVKIYKMLSFNWSFDVIYDDDTRIFGPEKDAPALQLKSIIGAGLQVRI